MGAAHQEPRRPSARSLSARDFRRRFPGGPRRPARQGRAKPSRGGDRAPQERMGGRISAMAEARFVGALLRLRLGGRRLFAGAPGAAGRMHAGADGGDAGGQEGVDRLSDGHEGERAKLEGAARRFEGARPVGRAASRHWRWRARVLEGPRRGVPDDASSAMLDAQDIEWALSRYPTVSDLTRSRLRMALPPVSYKRHRFPPQIIAHAVWLYFRFPLSLRLVRKCCSNVGSSSLTKPSGAGRSNSARTTRAA